MTSPRLRQVDLSLKKSLEANATVRYDSLACGIHMLRSCISVQVGIAIVYCLFAAGIVFGYAAIKPVLIDEGAFDELCTQQEIKNGVSPCYQQEIRLNLMFTVAAVSTNVAALPIGMAVTPAMLAAADNVYRHYPGPIRPSSLWYYKQYTPVYWSSAVLLRSQHLWRRIHTSIFLSCIGRPVYFHLIVPAVEHLSPQIRSDTRSSYWGI
jgi:hypothetical protein